MWLRLALVIALRNMGARRGRVLLTTLAIVYSVALLVALQTVTHGIRLTLLSEVQGLLPTDVLVYSSSVSIPEAVVPVMARLPHVEQVVPAVIIGTSFLEGRPVTLLGISQDEMGFFRADLVAGRLPSRPGEAIVQDTLANRMGLKIGDYIYVNVIENVQGTYRVIRLRVVGLFRSILGGFLGFQLNMIVTQVETLQAELGNEGFVNALFIKLRETSPAALDDFTKRLSRAFPNAEVYQQQSLLGAVSRLVSIINGFFLVIIALSLLVTGLSVANTAMMNVRERLREVGILKALGASGKQVVAVFALEILIMSIVGSFVGIVLGLLGSYGIRETLKYLGLGLNIPIEPLPQLYALSVAAAVGTSLIASAIPLRQVVKVRPMEVLRME